LTAFYRHLFEKHRGLKMAEGLKNAQKNVHDAHFSVHGI